MSVTTYHFLFTAQVLTPLELDEHSGSALRGTLFEAVWRRFCTNKASASCTDCPLHAVCPVSALVAPLREENQRGRDIPRPYIILPPLEARRYECGQALVFGITLFGSIIELLPYIVLSLQVMETCGLGRKLAENHGQRGTFRIQHIEAYHPLTGERQSIYQEGKALVQSPTLAVSATDVSHKAATLPADAVTLDFLTPTRLIDHDRLLYHIAFRSLMLRLLERLAALEATYNAAAGEEWRNAGWRYELVAQAEFITCNDNTHWEEVHSYSQRQRRLTPISGFVGKATFMGNLAPFRELLIWGELVHVGKNVVKGNGWYKVAEPV